MKMSESIKELGTALAKFQGEVKNPNNEATNPQFKSKYAPLDVVINTVKPLLAKYGLSFFQSTSTEGEKVGITTLLIHESGEWIQSDTLFLPAYQTKGGGVKDHNAQAIGSSTTYGRRYQLSSILGISSEDDDDGNSVSGQNNKGYQEANKPQGNSGGGLSDAEKEKRKQEAIAKAQARQNANKQETEQEGKDELANEKSNEKVQAEKISPQQEKAIDNMMNILARKKGEGFNKEEYLGGLLSKYAVDSVSDVSSDNAREIIAKINADRAGK